MVFGERKYALKSKSSYIFAAEEIDILECIGMISCVAFQMVH